MNNCTIGIVILSLLLFSFSTSALDYTIENNKVYIDDSHIFLSAEPHTLTESGYVYYNLTSKHFTGEDLSTYATTKIVLQETLSTIQTFVDNVVRIIPFVIGGFVVLFIIMIAGMITNTLKRW